MAPDRVAQIEPFLAKPGACSTDFGAVSTEHDHAGGFGRKVHNARLPWGGPDRILRWLYRI